MGDIANVDDSSIAHGNGQIVQFGDLNGAIVQLDIVFVLADFGGPGGNDLVLCGDRGLDILRRQAFGLKRLRVEIDLDLPFLSPVRLGHRCPLNGC